MQNFPPCSFYSIQFRGIEYIHNAKLLSLASTSWWMGLFLSYEKKLYTHYRQRCCSVTQLCPTLCHCMDYSIPGFLVLHHLSEFAQIMSIEPVMPSNHLILCHSLLLPSIFLSIRVFSNESALHITWPKYWSFSFSFRLSKEYSGLIPLGLTSLISLLLNRLLRVFSIS